MAQAAAVRQVDEIELPVRGEWEIDPAHSSVSFVARHLVVGKVRGKFGSFGVP